MLVKKLLLASRLCELQEVGEQKWLGYLSQSPQKQKSSASTPQHPCPLVAALLVACGGILPLKRSLGMEVAEGTFAQLKK